MTLSLTQRFLLRCHRSQMQSFNRDWNALCRAAFKQATEFHDRNGREIKLINTYYVRRFLDQFNVGTYHFDGASVKRCEYDASQWDAEVFTAILRPDVGRTFRRPKI